MGAHRHALPQIPEPVDIRENTGGVPYCHESWYLQKSLETTSFSDVALITHHEPEYCRFHF